MLADLLVHAGPEERGFLRGHLLETLALLQQLDGDPPDDPPPGGGPAAAERGFAARSSAHWYNSAKTGRPTEEEGLLAAALLVATNERAELQKLKLPSLRHHRPLMLYAM